jgi:TolA-binding protein
MSSTISPEQLQEGTRLVKEHMPRLVKEEAKRLAFEGNLKPEALEEAVFKNLQTILKEEFQNSTPPGGSEGGEDPFIRRESPEYKAGQIRANIEQLQDKIKSMKREFEDNKQQKQKEIMALQQELKDSGLNHAKHVQTYTAKIAHLQQDLANASR